MKRFLFLITALAALGCSSAPKDNNAGTQNDYVTKAGRMDRSRLNIGVYHLRPYARTEAHIKDLADCGIDFVICMDNDRQALDLFSKYNVGAIVSGIVPGWWGGDGDNAGKLAESTPLHKYEEAAAQFNDHPAIWGIDIGDEPSALDFPYYKDVMTKVEEVFPNQFAFLNLYPNYASVSQNTADQTKSQLGTATYSEYIDEYCKNVPSDYISYDFYYKNVGVTKDYQNLKTVADACQATGRSMWVTVQVNSQNPDVWITENELRFQAYSALAFGAESVTWACYTAGWWNNQVVDEDGNKTRQYEKLKRVNAELHAIGGEYMRYRCKGTSFVGFDEETIAGTGAESVNEYSDETFKELHTTGECPLLVGRMEGRTRKAGNAVFVCVADDPFDKSPATYTLQFRAGKGKISAYDGNGKIPVKKNSDGVYECSVASSQGILIESSR
ncbi:MAG: hypothetical protein IJ205_02265 [Bacteroidales bacterium]|nr:hypothetical protein [Bacteroidales bacterium]